MDFLKERKVSGVEWLKGQPLLPFGLGGAEGRVTE